jgi:Flp pilus assembly protein TadD
LNDLHAAEAAFRTAIDLRPNSAASYSYLGCVFEQLGNYEKARNAWEEAIRVAPNEPAAMDARERLSRVASARR